MTPARQVTPQTHSSCCMYATKGLVFARNAPSERQDLWAARPPACDRCRSCRQWLAVRRLPACQSLRQGASTTAGLSKATCNLTVCHVAALQAPLPVAAQAASGNAALASRDACQPVRCRSQVPAPTCVSKLGMHQSQRLPLCLGQCCPVARKLNTVCVHFQAAWQTQVTARLPHAELPWSQQVERVLRAQVLALASPDVLAASVQAAQLKPRREGLLIVPLATHTGRECVLFVAAIYTRRLDTLLDGLPAARLRELLNIAHSLGCADILQVIQLRAAVRLNVCTRGLVTLQAACTS